MKNNSIYHRRFGEWVFEKGRGVGRIKNHSMGSIAGGKLSGKRSSFDGRMDDCRTLCEVLEHASWGRSVGIGWSTVDTLMANEEAVARQDGGENVNVEEYE